MRRLVLAVVLIVGAGAPGAAMGVAPETGAQPACTGRYFNYLMAQQEGRLGHWDEAAVLLERALACDPDSSYLHRELAMAHVHQEDFDAAVAVIETLLDRHAEDVQGWLMLGRLKQRTNQRAAARSAYEKVLALDPAERDTYLLLGRMYIEDRDWSAAQTTFEQFVRQFPDVFAGHFLLAKTYEALGRFADAVAAYQKSSELAADEVAPRYELIRLYEKMGREAEVEAQYRELLDLNPHDPRAGLALALRLHRQGKTEAAQKLLARFARRSRDDDTVIRTLVRRHLDEKADPAQARVLLDGMLAATPDNADLHYLAGIVSDRLDRFDEAIGHFRQVRPESGFFEDAVVHVGYLYQKRGRLDEAVAYLENAAAQRPDNPDFQLYLGTFHEEREDYESAEKALRKGLELAPESIKIHFRLGVVYDKWDRKTDSIAQMKRVLDLDPKHANALNYLGYTYADMGIHLDDAERLIKQALVQEPDDGYITDSLGWVYYQQGRYEEALPLLERAASLAPDDPVILEHLGDTYHKLGRTDEAVAAYRKALTLEKSDRDALTAKIEALGGHVD